MHGGEVVGFAAVVIIFGGIFIPRILRELVPLFTGDRPESPSLQAEVQSLRKEVAELRGLRQELSDLRRVTGEKLLSLELRMHQAAAPPTAAVEPPEADESPRVMAERGTHTSTG